MTNQPAVHELRGRIAVPPGIPAERATTIRVQVEDVSRMDVPSTVVAEQQLHDVDLIQASEVPFQVNVPIGAIDPGKRYSVRVHIDVNGSGQVTKGDYVSTASHPVLTAGSPDNPTVTVRRV